MWPWESMVKTMEEKIVVEDPKCWPWEALGEKENQKSGAKVVNKVEIMSKFSNCSSEKGWGTVYLKMCTAKEPGNLHKDGGKIIWK